MKEKMKGRQYTEEKGLLGKVLTTAALLGVLGLAPIEGSAQNVSGSQGGETVTEVTTPETKIDTTKTIDFESAKKEIKDSTCTEISSTISGPDTLGGDLVVDEGDSVDMGEGVEIEPDPEGEKEPELGDELDEQDSQESADASDTPKKEESKIRIGGMIQFGTGVAADAAEVCSDIPEMTKVFDISHKGSGLGLSIVRLEDFGLDKHSPCSQATIIDPYFSKQFGPDGKLKLTIDGKYTIIDKKPELSGFAPDIKLAYSDKGWTVEAMYIHKFQKGEDSDAFRLSVSKMFGEVFQLTAQAWYETGYDKHFYGRVISTVDLGHGFLVEMSFIAKHGKITPTAGILYRFQR